VAEQQDALVKRAQCLAVGFMPSQLTRVSRPDGRWQRVLPGVYAVETGRLSPRQRARAALLYAGPSAQLTGASALSRYGLRYLPPDDGLVHVRVPVQRRTSSRDLVRMHRTSRMPLPRLRDGLLCAPPEHAAILACRLLNDLAAARALMAEVVQRRWTTTDRLAEVLASGHSAGSALPRRVRDDLGAGCRSAPEMELRDLVSRSPLLRDGVSWNHPLLVDGRQRVGDACWPEVWLLVEVDSVEHHGLGWTPEATSRRRAQLTAAGWTVLSVSPYRIRHDGPAVLEEIERTYRRLAMIHAA
jgi:hypothetical protein